MRNKNNKRGLVVAIMLLLIVGVSVGYAALSTTLNITGTSSINKAVWDVHFNNITVTDGSVTPSAPVLIASGGSSISYTVNLSNPGDFYEFSVDVVNGGTINAVLSADPTITGLTTEQAKYASYSVKYADGGKIAYADTLNSDTTKTVKVRVEFKRDIVATDLPATGTTLNLQFSMNYVQN